RTPSRRQCCRLWRRSRKVWRRCGAVLLRRPRVSPGQGGRPHERACWPAPRRPSPAGFTHRPDNARPSLGRKPKRPAGRRGGWFPSPEDGSLSIKSATAETTMSAAKRTDSNSRPTKAKKSPATAPGKSAPKPKKKDRRVAAKELSALDAAAK